MFSSPKVEQPPPPPSTPTYADASVKAAGQRATAYGSFFTPSSSPTGFTRKSSTIKPTLIGGN